MKNSMNRTVRKRSQKKNIRIASTKNGIKKAAFAVKMEKITEAIGIMYLQEEKDIDKFIEYAEKHG